MTVPHPASPVERIDLSRSEDPRDVVHGAVIALSQGERILIATEQVAGILSSVLFADALDHPIAPLARPEPEELATLLVRGVSELADWVPNLSPATRKLAGRCWPGPVTLLFPDPGTGGLFDRLRPEVRSLLKHERGVSFQCPDSPFLHDVLRLLSAPPLLRPLSWINSDTRDLDALAKRAGCRLLIEAPRGVSNSSTTSVIQVDSNGSKLLRAGALDESTLARWNATLILFICTGNTCRSPMAEALCKVLLAERIGCEPSQLAERGYVVASAGVSAMNGMPAAANAVDVVRARGGSLEGHRSSRLSHDLIRDADHILAMTADHLDTLLYHAPEAAPRARLLHPAGLDVDDPVGSDRATYQRTADEIESYLRVFLDALPT